MAALATLLPTSLGIACAEKASDDDGHVFVPICTPKQEAFAQAWARTGNKNAAYRIAYNVRPNTLPNIVWTNACRVSELPQVKARYNELVQQAALETIMTVRELLQLQVDIATADPTEVIKTILRACRYCYGFEHAYQWKDADEYLKECVTALDNKQDPPLDTGGYGFNGALKPVPTCTNCHGDGIPRVVITPSDELTGKARKLFAGAKQDRFGAIEVKLHDQQKASELAGRILGAFNDKLDLRTPAERAAADAASNKMSSAVSSEDAAKAYLTLLNPSAA